MTDTPDKAFILAAGKGTRLRPYTDTMPKPMVEIAGESIIRRTISKLADVGVKEVVVNLHHLAPVLEAHLKGITNPKIILSSEHELLETGGGIKHARHYFGDEPFYIINGDALWDDRDTGTALARLAAMWDPARMDILLFLQPKAGMSLTGFVGDYNLDQDGKASRALDKTGEYMFAGIRIAQPYIFDESPDGAFSFLTLMDKAQAAGRLYGLVHDDAWYHISTPEDLESVDAAFRARVLK